MRKAAERLSHAHRLKPLCRTAVTRLPQPLPENTLSQPREPSGCWIIYPGERVADLLRENAMLRFALVGLEGQASMLLADARPGLEDACELAREVMK